MSKRTRRVDPNRSRSGGGSRPWSRQEEEQSFEAFDASAPLPELLPRPDKYSSLGSLLGSKYSRLGSLLGGYDGSGAS
jgi:hypothetical protein